MSQKKKNLIISLLFGFAVLMIAAAFSLHFGAIAKDYIRAAYALFGVVGLAILVVIYVIVKEDDSLDKFLLGALIAVMAVASLFAGIGVFTKFYATEALTQQVVTWVTTFNAVVLFGIWYHTAFVNDDFVN